MENILRFIVKYHFILIFVLLESIALSLIVSYNNYQRTIFFNETNALFAYVSSGVSSINNYFYLNDYNQQLIEENHQLREKIEILERGKIISSDSTHSDTTNYTYFSANVINNTYNRSKNYITLDEGTNMGLTADMGVCENNKVVGIIENVSSNFAVVQPLINTKSRISAKISKNDYYGSLQWDGNDCQYSYLNDIPFHVNVMKGDTVVTTGFSDYFNEGLIIGYVEEIDKDAVNFLTIKVKLAVDFRTIHNVNIVNNNLKEERIKLEELSNNDEQE